MFRSLSALLLLAAFSSACATTTTVSDAPPIVQPGAPGQPTRDIAPAQATDISRVQFTEADVKFMQGMIGHHEQAVEMVAMIPSRTTNEALRALGRKIDVSQEDEIKMMQSWLTSRGQQVPAAHAMHMHGATLMPGMLSPEEMDALAKSSGRAFEKLFLEGMIKHHAGALTMVQELFATPGAGQDSEIFAFASDVDADQSMEITRMRAMRQELEQ
jgi:uncharacterized protein (DUF305 family)